MEKRQKLVTVTNREIIAKLKNRDINLLYPLRSFCVGYEEEFDITEIDDFILVNRLLNDSELDELSNILKNANIKGIVFDDLGIIEVVKHLNITKILLLDHLATNTRSINYYLEYVDNVVVSNDLTKEEIRDIVNHSKKPLVVNVFGCKTLMYSRRLLLTNYAKYHKLEEKKYLSAHIDAKYFRIIENAYGTKFYASKYYNGLELLNLDNVLYYWYDPIFLHSDKITQVVFNNDLTDIASDPLFLNVATYYKVGDKNA